VPIMAANMDTVGTLEIAKVLSKEKMITCLHKHFKPVDVIDFSKNVDKEILSYIALSAGVSDEDFSKVKDIFSEVPEIPFICLDVANGYQSSFIDRVSIFREAFPGKIIIAGNVVTQEITQILIQAGADIIKLGIGPGSVCTTRK
jgi:GMP reductase